MLTAAGVSPKDLPPLLSSQSLYEGVLPDPGFDQ
jgi:hypothetical protein